MRWLPTSKQSSSRFSSWRPFTLATLLVLTLALSGCATGLNWRLTPGQSNSPTTRSSGALGCLAPSKPAPSGGCIVTDAKTGVSLHLVDAYADVTGTVAKLQTSNTANFPLMFGETHLALPSGEVLPWGNGGFTSGPTALLVDAPLPPQDLTAPATLIVTASVGPLVNPGGPALFGGPVATPIPTPTWLNDIYQMKLRLPFTLSPARSASYTFNQAPVVKRGIGVQVESLDTSPAHAAFFGQAGGARVMFRFTGLPKGMELLSFIRVTSARTVSGGTTGDRGPGQVALNIPGMALGDPASTFLLSPTWPTNSPGPGTAPTIGSAGTVEFEAVYLGSGAPTGAPATLTISDIQLLTGGIDGNSGAPTLPSYQITLPLK